MKVWTDLHIHSCLSPCADDEMTPYNIVHMAKLKGLDMIAVTDHNTAGNLPALCHAGEEIKLTVVPGMELTTREEVHVLAYFPELSRALECDWHVRKHLPQVPNDPRFFGNQIIMGAEDEMFGIEPLSLLQALELSIEELFALVRRCGGVPVPAHIDRESHGILSVLGFINPGLGVTVAELSRGAKDFSVPRGITKTLVSSDAHQLGDILEKEHFLELEDNTPSAFLKFLHEGQN